jgi:hypothetical protein
MNGGRGAMVARRGLNFRAPGSIAAGVGGVLVTGQYNSSQRLLDLGEKGVYSSYTLGECIHVAWVVLLFVG